MNSWITLLLFGVVIFGVIVFILRFVRHYFPATLSHTKSKTPYAPHKSSTHKTFTIGIISPLAHSPALLLQEGLVQQLSLYTQADYTIKLFHGNNDRVAIFNQVMLAAIECDILITDGLSCTNIAYEALKQTRKHLPIFFVGLKPQHIPLLKKHNPRKKLMGIIGKSDVMSQAHHLKLLKPALKSVLIMYRQGNEWLLEKINDLSRCLRLIGITAIKHLLAHNTHIDNQLSGMKESFDTIFLMPQTLTAKGIQELITYCNSEKITLCANELDAVTLGAAIGFGGEALETGIRAARHIRDILEFGTHFKDHLFLEYTDFYRVHLNARTLTLQDITCPPELLFLLKNGEIVQANTQYLEQEKAPSVYRAHGSLPPNNQDSFLHSHNSPLQSSGGKML